MPNKSPKDYLISVGEVDISEDIDMNYSNSKGVNFVTCLLEELEKGKKSAQEKGWISTSEVEAALNLE